MTDSTYTIYLPQDELRRFDDIKPYEYMNDDSTTQVFEQALYPIFNYYKKRTKHIATSPLPVAHKDEKDTLTIKETSSAAALLLQKLFPKKDTLLIDSREARFDVERTWNIITSSRDFTGYKKVCLAIRPWTKLVYSYRLDKVYGLAITDITTY